jgi:glycosyltransferase involved in cell wall biosynthesis
VQHSVTANDGDSEGTPNAVLEAGASGLPVVSTRHAGIKEAVIEMKTGLLVDEGDIDGMAQHMIRLAKDSALAASLGKTAREWISAEYSMDKSIGKLWSIIESVIDQKRNSNHGKE